MHYRLQGGVLEVCDIIVEGVQSSVMKAERVIFSLKLCDVIYGRPQ